MKRENSSGKNSLSLIVQKLRRNSNQFKRASKSPLLFQNAYFVGFGVNFNTAASASHQVSSSSNDVFREGNKQIKRLRVILGLAQYLACALAAGAKVIVSRDDDLLAMKKPFGIQIITPRELLANLSKPV
jgi:hypothetical protein